MLIPRLMENDIKNLAEFNFSHARVVFPLDLRTPSAAAADSTEL